MFGVFVKFASEELTGLSLKVTVSLTPVWPSLCPCKQMASTLALEAVIYFLL